MFFPLRSQVVRRSILPAMPKELGEYLLDSGAGVKVGGEVIVQGPPLEALTVDLSMGQKGAQGGDRVGAESGPRQYFMSRSYKARTRRQGLEGQQDHLLAALDILGIDAAQAAVLAELFSTYIGLVRRSLNPPSCPPFVLSVPCGFGISSTSRARKVRRLSASSTSVASTLPTAATLASGIRSVGSVGRH